MNRTTPNKNLIASPPSQNSWSWNPNMEESPSNDEILKNTDNQMLNKSFDSAKTEYDVSKSTKRGRPKSELLTTLMLQGSTSPSTIKCKYCNRVFPRDKSLSAHLRTHTGMI